MSPPTPSDSPPSTPLPPPHTQNNQTKLHPTKLRQQWSNKLKSDAKTLTKDEVVLSQLRVANLLIHGGAAVKVMVTQEPSIMDLTLHLITMTTNRLPWWQITTLTNRSPWWQTNQHDNQQITMTTKDHHNNKRNYHYDDKQITTLSDRSPWPQANHRDNQHITMTTEWWQTDHHIDRSPWPQANHHDNQQTTMTTITMMTNRSPCWQTGHHDHKHDNQQITMTNKWNGKDVGCTYALSNKDTSWSFSAAVQDIIIASAISPTAIS